MIVIITEELFNTECLSQKQINKWKQSIQPEAVHAPRLQHQGQLRGTSPSQGFV